MEDILCGWLTKSPGDKFVTFLKGKVHIPVKAKWRRRFFRLYRPSPLFPNRYKLSYYKDDSLQNKLGSINLAQCEKIESSLDTAYYQHLFAIQVSSQNNRLYYLAADTEEAMLKWVECLCRICNLHQECRQSDNNSTSEEKIFKGPSTSSAITEVSREAEAKGYVHLSQCYTAPDSAMYDDYDVPPTLTSPSSRVAAPTPRLRNLASVQSDTEESVHQIYLNPASSGRPHSSESEAADSGINADDKRTTSSHSGDDGDNFGVVPPPRPPKISPCAEEPRESIGSRSYEECKMLEEMYDVPKNITALPTPCVGNSSRIHKYFNASTKHVSEEVSEDPHSLLTRHPKPPRDTVIDSNSRSSSYTDMNHFAESPNEVYEIAPRAQPIAPDHQCPSDSSEDVYDIAPRAQPIAPDPQCQGDSSEDVYDIAPRAQPVAPDPQCHGDSLEDVYDIAPRAQPVRSPTQPATPVAHCHNASSKNVYGSPRSLPQARPRTTIQSAKGSNQLSKASLSANSWKGNVVLRHAAGSSASDSSFRISQTSKTLSYVRDSVFSDSVPGAEPILGIRLPTRAGADDSSEDSTDDSDDEDDQIYDVPPQRFNNFSSHTAPSARSDRPTACNANTTVIPVAAPRTTVLARSSSNQPLQYIQLDHQCFDSNKPPPRPIHLSSSSSQASGVQYVAIDHTKTQGLIATKNERADLRKATN